MPHARANREYIHSGPRRPSIHPPSIGVPHHAATPLPATPPSPHSPSLPHVIELEPVISYPVGHVNAHVRLPEAAPPAHEAPAAPVLVEAATLMAGHVTSEQVG